MSGQGKYREPRAHELRARYVAAFGGADLPVPVEAVAEDLLGLHISEADLDGISGLLYPARRRIVVNADESPERKRFTVAHELGHWVCQCVGAEEPQEVFCRTEDISLDRAGKALEREANVFAAEFLMPEQAVRSAWDQTWDIERCASLFGISGPAMQWRLYSFGLVAEGPA